MIESAARAERVSLQGVSAPAFTWAAPEKPVCVQVPFTLIDRLEHEVVENFRSLTSRGSEIGGILLGPATPGNPATVYLEDFELIPCDYSRGPLYRLSDADLSRFERTIEQRTAGGSRVAGFFRSHTRKGLSLDAEDLSFFSARFRDPAHVALLVRPYASKPSTAGFFLWEGGAVEGEASPLEFPFRSSQLTGARPGAAAVETAAPAPPVNSAGPANAAAPAPASPKPAMRAQIVPIASRREITLPPPPEHAAGETAAARPAETKLSEANPVEAKPAPAAAALPQDAPAAKETAAPKESAPKEKIAEPPKEKAAAPAMPAKEPAKELAKPPAAEKAAAAVVEKPAPPQEKEASAPQKSASRGRTAMVAVLAAAALLGGMVLFVYPGLLRHGKASAPAAEDAPSLSLRVERTGTDILLTWNRDSAAILHAKHAVLTISDGDRHENYDMDLGQLRNGSIVYSPLTADVSFRMDVTEQGNGKPASESVRVLRTRPSPMPDGSQPPVDTAAKTNAKPAEPEANAPATPSDTGEPEQAPAPSRAGAPARPFNTASLAQRLRPATPADIPLPAAPTLSNAQSAPAALPSIAGSISAPAPYVPPAAPAPPPAPAAATKKASPIGGQIVQAQLIYSKQPEYPKLARQMGVRGSVELVATIGTDGRVKKVTVEKGHPLLTKAASDAVMQWVYKPTLLNGTPVENDTHITLNFLGDR